MTYIQNLDILFTLIKSINSRRRQQHKEQIPCGVNIDQFYIYLKRNHARITEKLIKNKDFEYIKKMAVEIEKKVDEQIQSIHYV